MTIKVNHAGTWKTAQPRCRPAAAWVTPKAVYGKSGSTWQKVWPAGPTGGSISGGSWSFDNDFGDYRTHISVNVIGGVAPYAYAFSVTGAASYYRFGPTPGNADLRSDTGPSVTVSCVVTDADGFTFTLTKVLPIHT